MNLHRIAATNELFGIISTAAQMANHNGYHFHKHSIDTLEDVWGRLVLLAMSGIDENMAIDMDICNPRSEVICRIHLNVKSLSGIPPIAFDQHNSPLGEVVLGLCGDLRKAFHSAIMGLNEVIHSIMVEPIDESVGSIASLATGTCDVLIQNYPKSEEWSRGIGYKKYLVSFDDLQGIASMIRFDLTGVIGYPDVPHEAFPTRMISLHLTDIMRAIFNADDMTHLQRNYPYTLTYKGDNIVSMCTIIRDQLHLLTSNDQYSEARYLFDPSWEYLHVIAPRREGQL